MMPFESAATFLKPDGGAISIVPSAIDGFFNSQPGSPAYSHA